MKRNSYLIGFIMLIAILFSGCQGKSAAEGETVAAVKKDVIKLKMATCWTPNYALIEQDKYWIGLVHELVGDQVEIQLFTAGELVKSNEVFDAVSNNTVQIGSDFPGYWAGKDTAFNLVASFPMWMDAYDYINWLEFGGGLAEYERIYGNFNILPIPHGPITVESGPRGTKPIKSLADYKGLKIRMSGKNQGNILAQLGASQVSISSAEVYQGLQRGLIDAAESCTPEFDWGLGYGETTTFSSHPGWHQPGSMGNLLFNKDAWNELPANVQSAFRIAAKATIARTLAFQDYSSADGTQKFREAGVKEFKLSMEDLKTIADLSLEQIYKESAINPSFAKIALSMGEYLHHYAPWRELSYPFNHGWKDKPLPDLDKIRPYAK
ncbi:MAG: TRAP transporter substrate-binding protein DctP [Spirochaetia bacterium]|jgi:TRAP-type mannitol/chloroaromatic compound transport system substrate-binding protein|nr:TRAP transporter substrate-binding protein DctP [Spirochaetia bacterium]